MECVNGTLCLGDNEQALIPVRTRQSQHVEDIMNNQLSLIVRVIILIIISPLIALFGIFANAINMVVFYRQGFNTTTNISFFALAISDMLCLVTCQWYVICLNPFMETADLSFVPKEVQYLSGGWFHVCCGRITSWITVFITAERCLGITLPLKVKQIVTLKRTTISMCAVFIVNLAALLPEYSIAYLDWKFVQVKNRSLYGMVYRNHKEQISELTFVLTSASGMLSIICVIFLTTFLVTSLKRKSKWRKLATGGSDNADTRSSRDQKTMKMIIMIATVLIVCYIPGTGLSLITAFVPDFNINNALENTFFTIWSIAFACDAFNSSVNMLLYYRMSTKYRQTFNEIFSCFIKADSRTLRTNKQMTFSDIVN